MLELGVIRQMFSADMYISVKRELQERKQSV